MLRINNRAIDRLVRMAVRIIDAMDSETQCLFDKHPQNHDLIDSEVRNVFSRSLIAALLKCTLGLNMHGARCCSINKNVID